MSTEHKLEMMKRFEKSLFKSKKFIAFLIMEALLTTLAILALKWQPSLGWPLSAFMVSIVFIMGFIAISFNGKQATLDMYVRMAAITGRIHPRVKNKIDDTTIEGSEEALDV